ncbi:MAG TPA: LacI family DNA-binding transcriptional regulator [Chthoniobacteraceae bacterium]|nr:LacI family DNA-binding transcriptional regulator [Chthoniobacteraceae bacterium]
MDTLSQPVTIPTLRHVAKQARVSLSTASSVMNGHAERLRISAKTQERVLTTAEQLGYQPNPLAAGLRLKRSQSIGVLWSFAGPHGSSQLVRNFSGQAMQHGYSTLVYDTLNDPELIVSQLRAAAKNRVDGVVFAIGRASIKPFLPLLEKLPHVVLVTARPYDDLPFLQIIHCMTRALHDAVHHLVAAGRDRFAFIGSLPGNTSKTEAISAALKAAGLSRPLSLFHCSEAFPFSQKEEDWSFRTHPEFTSANAIFAATDEIAAAVTSALHEAGRKVPEEVAVVGFNNSPFASLFTPPLASIQRFDDLLAHRAMERIIAAIEERHDAFPHTETINMEFIWRSSAGAPPAP